MSPHQKCALVIHGLNTKPDKMKNIADLLREQNFKTELAVLSGHSEDHERNSVISKQVWENEFRAQWNSSTKTCQSDTDSRVLIGYSLGALVALHHFDTLETKPLPTKMILLAPAISLRSYVNSIRLFSWLPWLKIPSLNHADYRAQEYTPVRAYSALFQIHDIWQKKRFTQTEKVSTLVVLSERDELIDSQEVNERIKQLKENLWKVIWVNNDETKLTTKYHHLIIDKESLGEISWNELTEEIKNHLK